MGQADSSGLYFWETLIYCISLMLLHKISNHQAAVFVNIADLYLWWCIAKVMHGGLISIFLVSMSSGAALQRIMSAYEAGTLTDSAFF